MTYILPFIHEWTSGGSRGGARGGLGPRSPPPPLLFLGDRPLSPLPSPLSPLPSPLISRSGSGTVNIATVSMDRMALRSPVQYPLASPQTAVGVRLSRIEKWMRDNRTPTDVCGEAKYPSAVWLCMFVFELPFFSPPTCRRPKCSQWEEYSWILSVHFSETCLDLWSWRIVPWGNVIRTDKR